MVLKHEQERESSEKPANSADHQTTPVKGPVLGLGPEICSVTNTSGDSLTDESPFKKEQPGVRPTRDATA